VATIPRVQDLRARLIQAPTGQRADPALSLVVLICALAVLVLVVAIGTAMAIAARPALARFGFGFLTSQVWDPVNDHFGALPFIYGTIVTSALAVIVGAPIALVAVQRQLLAFFDDGKADIGQRGQQQPPVLEQDVGKREVLAHGSLLGKGSPPAWRPEVESL